jgi:hypothetical protein
MYEKPISPNLATTLPMGTGAGAPFHPADRRLFVGGPAHAEVRSWPEPIVRLEILARAIDHLADPQAEYETAEYMAARVTFGGKVYRTWRVRADALETHAAQTITTLIEADPRMVHDIREDQ